MRWYWFVNRTLQVQFRPLPADGKKQSRPAAAVPQRMRSTCGVARACVQRGVRGDGREALTSLKRKEQARADTEEGRRKLLRRRPWRGRRRRDEASRAQARTCRGSRDPRGSIPAVRRERRRSERRRGTELGGCHGYCCVSSGKFRQRGKRGGLEQMEGKVGGWGWR